MANDDADKAPWTIKSVDVGVRKMAVKCALHRGETMAEWLARAVRAQANVEAGDQVIPPSQPDSPPMVGLNGQSRHPLGMTDLAETMRAAAMMAEASGVPAPKTAARHAFAILTATLREARGLPPVRRRERQRLIEG